MNNTCRSGLGLPPLSGSVVAVEMVLPNGEHVLIEPRTANNPYQETTLKPKAHPMQSGPSRTFELVATRVPEIDNVDHVETRPWKEVFGEFRHVPRKEKWISSTGGLGRCLDTLKESLCCERSCAVGACAACIACAGCCSQHGTRSNLEAVMHDEQKLTSICCGLGGHCRLTCCARHCCNSYHE